MIKHLYLLTLLLFTNSLMAQNDVHNEIDTTAFLLGMLEYPLVTFSDNAEYEYMITAFNCKDEFVEELFIAKLKTLDTVTNKEIEVVSKGKYNLLKSKAYSSYLKSYLSFVPYTRKSILKKELQNQEIFEGYINPYKLSFEQQKAFVLGLVVAKADIYQPTPSDANSITGKYILRFSKSEIYYTLAYYFLESHDFKITGSGSSSRHRDYETFDGHIKFEAPPSLDGYISSMIQKRKERAGENCK